MFSSHKNISLIGMPGVGKSTVGVILAKELGLQFVDTDLLIQNREHRLLKDIIKDDGIDGFMKVESDVIKSLDCTASLIATGGSVVYGEEAMAHLKEISTVVYLSLPYDKLKTRLGSLTKRGVVLRTGQDLRALYDERIPLYEKYADVVVSEVGLTIEETVNQIIDIIK
ncbi:MAG: shikimate kinase [Lachnospiraceae bacterium]|nr:shikimate kinase [Lachnospiraceae bacterium]